jgi:hypothetical protein
MDKTSTYNEIQQTLEEIFLNNLRFFKDKEPAIYAKIIEFEELAIENYCINFKDNKFQLTDLENNTNFYETDPFIDATNKIKNFDIASAFNLINIEPLQKRNHYKNEINAYEYLNEFIKNFNNIDIKINKFIFLGTLLGVHINDFHQFLKAKVYFIIEPNIEIFRLSMFMTDYKFLYENAKIFFAINENEDTLKEITKEFLNHHYEFNNLIHFELAHKINTPLINQLSVIFTHLGEMRYPFSEYLINLNRFHNYFIKNNNNLLNISKIYNFLENKEILFLGAGPSLEKNLDFVNTNKNKFILVVVAATLKILETKKIIPDIIITIDGQQIISEQFNVHKSMYENSIILSSTKLDFEIYKILKNTKLFFFQNSLNLFKELGFITGVTVGDIGIDLLLRFGVKNLYLLGIDAAIDSETGTTHIKTHSHSKKVDFKNSSNNKIDFNKTIIYVKGNFEKEVPTFLEYKEMIEEINTKLGYLDNSFKIYNLSNGAYFKNTIPTQIDTLIIKETIIDKNISKDIFFTQLNDILEVNLKNKFQHEFNKEKKVLLELNSLVKDKTFFKKFIIFQEIYSDSISIKILEKYFKLVLPYYNLCKENYLVNNIQNVQLTKILSKLFKIFID